MVFDVCVIGYSRLPGTKTANLTGTMQSWRVPIRRLIRA